MPDPIMIHRTGYQGMPNRWRVVVGDTHSTHHDRIEDVELLVRVIMQQQLDDEAGSSGVAVKP